MQRDLALDSTSVSKHILTAPLVEAGCLELCEGVSCRGNKTHISELGD